MKLERDGEPPVRIPLLLNLLNPDLSQRDPIGKSKLQHIINPVDPVNPVQFLEPRIVPKGSHWEEQTTTPRRIVDCRLSIVNSSNPLCGPFDKLRACLAVQLLFIRANSCQFVAEIPLRPLRLCGFFSPVPSPKPLAPSLKPQTSRISRTRRTTGPRCRRIFGRYDNCSPHLPGSPAVQRWN